MLKLITLALAHDSGLLDIGFRINIKYMSKKIITKYGSEDFRIEETKTIKVVSTANIKILAKEIETLEKEKAERDIKIPEKKALLKELKAIKVIKK